MMRVFKINFTYPLVIESVPLRMFLDIFQQGLPIWYALELGDPCEKGIQKAHFAIVEKNQQ